MDRSWWQLCTLPHDWWQEGTDELQSAIGIEPTLWGWNRLLRSHTLLACRQSVSYPVSKWQCHFCWKKGIGSERKVQKGLFEALLCDTQKSLKMPNYKPDRANYKPDLAFLWSWANFALHSRNQNSCLRRNYFCKRSLAHALKHSRLGIAQATWRSSRLVAPWLTPWSILASG